MKATMRPGPPVITPSDRRAFFRKAIHQCLDEIVAGNVTPARLELDALAALCDELDLPLDAARIRRWIPS